MSRKKIREHFLEYSVLCLVMLYVACTSDVTGVNKTGPTQYFIEISQSTASLYAGRTLQLVATVKDSKGSTISGETIGWTSSKNDVAVVSSNGLVSAVTFGSATITATAEGIATTATISVLHDPIIFVHGF
jgi:hypothetical protein